MKASLAPPPARAAPPAEAPPPPPRDDAIPRNEPGNEPPADTPGILPRKTLSHADAEAPG
jgi:hypothetical protein